VAGLLVEIAGVGAAFALNALSFLLPTLLSLRWRPPRRKTTGPAERLTEATGAAVRYVRYSPSARTLLTRIGSVTFFASALLALLPSVAMESGGGPLEYGALLGVFGAGAIAGALLRQPLRGWLSNEALVSTATLVLGTALAAAALVRALASLYLILVVAGAGWILYISILSARAQRIAPDWVPASMLAVHLLVFQGSLAVGSAVGDSSRRERVRVALRPSPVRERPRPSCSEE